MNLHIIGFENTRGENNDVHDLLWTLDNQDGVCIVREGRVESPQLCEAMHFDLTMRAQRDIRLLCQNWVDEKPERDRKNQEDEERYEAVKEAWDEFEKENVIRYAIPSVDYLPTDPAARGQVAFRITIWGEGDKREDYYFCCTNPTWGDVLRYFDRSIALTGDEHHCYLEGAYHVGEKEMDGNTVNIFEFSTGS